MGLRDRRHQLQAAPAGDRVHALMLATSSTDARCSCPAGGGRLGIHPNAVVGANRRLSQGALGWPRFFSVWAPSGDTGSEQIEVRCTSIRDARSANWGMGCRRRPGESNHVQPAHGTRAHEHGPGSVYAQLDRDAWRNRRRQQNQLRGQRGLRVSRRVGFFRWEACPGHRTDGGEGNQVNVRTEAA